MGYCNGPEDYYNISKADCVGVGEWQTFSINFDNVVNAMVGLYILSSVEGWPDIMQTCADSAPAETV